MPDPLTGKTFGFLYAEVQQQMFSKDSKHMKQNDLSTGTITVFPPSQAPSLGKGNTGPDIQPSTPRRPHGWKCRTGAWLPPVRFHGSFTPSRPPAGSLAPRFTAAQPATPSVKTAVILHPPPAASSATRKNVSRTTNNHTIYQHNKQTC